MLEHLSARTQQCGAGEQYPPEWKQIVLVAARAMQQEQRRPIRLFGRHKAMDEVDVRHGIYYRNSCDKQKGRGWPAPFPWRTAVNYPCGCGTIRI